MLSGCMDSQHVETENNIKVKIKKEADPKLSLMVVAHPDDESIFGGLHLMKHHYFIVVVTNGNNRHRHREFNEMLKYTKNQGVILSFPDKTNGVRDNWKSCYKKIYNKIQKYILTRDYDKIVTHNKTGEYGHQHHKMVHRIVTSICEKHRLTSHLYYFNKYYKSNDIGRAVNGMKKKELSAKVRELRTVYPSQSKVIDHLFHILPYENFQHYSSKTR